MLAYQQQTKDVKDMLQAAIAARTGRHATVVAADRSNGANQHSTAATKEELLTAEAKLMQQRERYQHEVTAHSCHVR